MHVSERRRLAGDIENLHTELRHLDAAVHLFDPDYKVENIRPKAFRPPKDWANRGEMSRMVLSILRQSAEPMTTRDIALQMLIERALDKDDVKLIRLMSKRVGVALRRKRDQGRVLAEQGPGQYMLWQVVR